MTQPTRLSALAILKDGIKLTKTNFLVYLPLIALSMLVIYFANQALMEWLQARSPEASLLDIITKSSAVIGLLLTPIKVGLMLMGLSAARGETIKFSDIKFIAPQSAKLIVLAMVIMLLVQIGFMLLILPGIFLMVVLSMAPMLMCDRNISMFRAVKLSAQTLSKQWFMLLLVYIWLIIAILLSFYTMGVALIITLPFYMNVKGLLYQQLFDMQSQATDAPDANNGEFEA